MLASQYLLARELTVHTSGRLDLETVIDCARAYQRVAPLSIGETWTYECTHVVTSVDPDPLPWFRGRERELDCLWKAVVERQGIAVISGEEEAELAALSALNNFDMEGTRYVMVDIGGGSVEVITALGNHIEEIYSLDLGAVILTENYISTDPITQDDYRSLRKHVRRTLKSAIAGEESPVQCLLGSGGTMTSIAAMVMAMRKEGYGSIHGYEVLRSEVVHLLAMLMRKDVKERRSIPGLPPDRADIIVAGVTVVDELMGLFKANLLKINERGIREGLILKGLKKRRLLPAESQLRNWRDSVLEFARSCHHDEAHSQQVAGLALEIFATLVVPFGSFALGAWTLRSEGSNGGEIVSMCNERS